MKDFVTDRVGGVLVSAQAAQFDQDDGPGGHIDSADERDGALADACEELFSHRGEAVNGRGAGSAHVQVADRMLVQHRGDGPTVHTTAWVAPTAVVIGRVTIGAGARILHGAVLSAEDGEVSIGEDTVVMEHALIRGRADHPTHIGAAVMVGPHAHVNGSEVGDEVFLATGASLFPGSRIGSGAEVRINAVVQVNTVLEPGAVVPIGWVAVGAPAVVLPPDRHDEVWAIQRDLDFPGTVYGVGREVSMREVMRRQSEFYGAHVDDREIGS